jgi:hypothetical protein
MTPMILILNIVSSKRKLPKPLCLHAPFLLHGSIELNFCYSLAESANNGLEEVVLKLLKSLKVCDLDNKQGTINPQQVNNFYVWKTDLLDQLCTAEVRK